MPAGSAVGGSPRLGQRLGNDCVSGQARLHTRCTVSALEPAHGRVRAPRSEWRLGPDSAGARFSCRLAATRHGADKTASPEALLSSTRLTGVSDVGLRASNWLSRRDESGHQSRAAFCAATAEDVRGHLLSQDVIWVGGGSVANLLATWRSMSPRRS